MYTKEEIDKYLSILNRCKKQLNPPPATSRGVSGGCNPPACNPPAISIINGQYVCDECGLLKGYVLGYFNIKENDRLFYRKKSVYNRKYHYEKKFNQISKSLDLNDEEKCQLFDELMKINDNKIMLVNKGIKKRLVNIFFLIRKILEEIGCKKYKLVNLKIKPNTLKKYEEWWVDYKGVSNCGPSF